MDYLHSIFESEVAVVLNDKGHAVIGETSYPPLDILKMDKEAYNNEYNNWLSRWLDEQRDKLEQVLKIPGNRPRFVDVCRAIGEGQVVPLVGSGMSCPSGLPIWSEFLLGMCEFSPDLASEDIETLIETGQYEEAADAIASKMSSPQFEERVDHDLRLEGGSSIAGPVRFLPELFPRLVMTTNLDPVLERLYVEAQQPFTQTLIGADIGRLRQLRASGNTILVKLHGDHHRSEGRVLGKAEYEKTYESTSVVVGEVTHVYQNYSLLFLGCSLGPDRIVQLVL